ncbi:hypothetical protein DNU06_05265 [Putridiphycobacter roseus]|uniref:Calcineurin-like phosphoesterase domain-containing protein n=1 Tax=Putridiphycobacter roseus TaxID=2219161 RepID=A0A2W1NTI1_9FLAO|nr:hypothetical protein [Putridiphycobacter roseus]PZE18028.1 hypothetical protein DNU06_05265 [Putridiphycobacter roseus]
MKYLIVLCLSFGTNALFADSIVSTFNQTYLSLAPEKEYDFIVSGHFHGSGTNKTGYPINSILGNTKWINESGAKYLVCLGDLFLDVSNDIPFYKSSFFEQLNIPLFNTVGNHDLTGNIYQENFGATYFSFRKNNEIHLFLDTELNDGSIKGEQLALLEKVKTDSKAGGIKALFIYSHRTVWAKNYPELDLLFKFNTQSMFGNNFSEVVYPILSEISAQIPIYWFSGSIGEAPASFFYHEDKTKNIKYIGTAIRGYKRDAILRVNINQQSEPTFILKSLTGQKLNDLESYDLKFWSEGKVEESFNYRLIPLYIKGVVFSRAFWYGITISLVFFFLFKFWKRRKVNRV